MAVAYKADTLERRGEESVARKMLHLTSPPPLQNGDHDPCLFLQGCCGDQVG